MFMSRLHYCIRRSPHKRLCSRELGSVDVSQNNKVKVTSDNVEASSQEVNHASTIPIDRRLQLQRLRNNFVRPGPGLRSSKNRNDLVAEFFDLSKSVMEGRLTVDELKQSQIIIHLEEQLNLHVDVMSNNQIVNMLASLVRMQFDHASNMLRLLEHEVKFRVNSLTLAQVMKLIRFYNSIETSFEQKQLTDILNNRLRSTLLSNKVSLDELIEIYHHLAEQNGQTNMLSLTEEKILLLLTDIQKDEDDIVTRYLPKTTPYDYRSLCNIFTELAMVKRRPTPLLKAASETLLKTSLPKDALNPDDLPVLINTLSSLVSLNYMNRALVSKLVRDLTDTINLDDLDLITQCNLLRTIGSLKWRSEQLLNLFYEYIETHTTNSKKVDHNLILTLFHVAAHLNYTPGRDVKKFYESCMKGPREELIDRTSRKWLNYVWSLAVLGLASNEHYSSVINDNFLKSIENPLGLQKINHADIMRLLNLRALAKLEDRSIKLESKMLDELAKIEMPRGSDMQKFSAKVREAMSGIVASSEKLSFDRQTPFGFNVNCEIRINENQNEEKGAIDDHTLDLDSSSLENNLANRPPKDKIVLIYVLFNETLASHPLEPVGHKRIASRILAKLGYKTIFVQEGVLNRYKNSADLCLKLQEIIRGTNSVE